MAKSFNKKEREQRKAKRRKEKLAQREERKANNNKGGSFDDMIAYVDQFGNPTDTPPEMQEREKIKVEDIQLGATPVEEIDSELTGTVVTFFEDKAYGFIQEKNSRETVFVHGSSSEEPLKENDKVTFEKERTPRGFSAINVKIIK